MINCIIIDDDSCVLELFSEMLHLINVEVIDTSNNGIDAVKMYQKYNPDIIFTDLNMPIHDGFYVIEEIKDIDINAKIIAITGDRYATTTALLKALKIRVITKPFDIHDVKQAIADVFIYEGLEKKIALKVEYRFKDDDKRYSCIVTYDQYRNFKKLPIIQECEITDNNQEDVKLRYEEMQEALDKAFQNDITHIRMLSKME